MCVKKEGSCGKGESCLPCPGDLSQRCKTLFPATFPKKGPREFWGSSPSHPDLWPLPSHSPKHNIRQRLLNQTYPEGSLRTPGKRAREASDLAPLQDNKDIAKNTPGFWWKKGLWKISHMKKSRNCTELRKWHYIITRFLAQQTHHQKGSVGFSFPSSKKSLNYVHTDTTIQFNLRFFF